MSTPTTERDEPDAQEWEDLPDGQEPPDQEWAPLPIPDTEGEPC